MIKMTMKFKGPSEVEKRRLIEEAAKEHLHKKGFSNLRVKTTKKSGEQYNLSVDGLKTPEFEKLTKQANERFRKLK